MHGINDEFNYLPENALKYLGQVMEVPLSQIYHVATFYTAFSLIPRGEHVIKVCMGTACHSRGGPEILERFKSILGIKPDETTEDGKISLHTVKCFGCCALGPVVNIGDQYYQTTLTRVAKIIDHFNKGKSHAKTGKHKRAGIL